MKPGKRDVKIFIKFTPIEFEFLQKNSFHMADCYGLDRRISKLTGKRKISFYSWDLDCIDAVLYGIKKECKLTKELKLIESINKKIEIGYQEIENEKPN